MEVFFACSTQWRQSFGGISGLDYSALETVLRLKRIKPKQQPQIFADVQLIERGVLTSLQNK